MSIYVICLSFKDVVILAIIIFSFRQFLPLKAKDEVRPITFSLGVLASRLSSSSLSPSEKYSCSASSDILTKGKTAMDFSGSGGLVGATNFVKRKKAARATSIMDKMIAINGL